MHFYSQWLNTTKVYFSLSYVGDSAPPSPSGALGDDGGLTILLLQQKHLMASLDIIIKERDREQEMKCFFGGRTHLSPAHGPLTYTSMM